MNDPDRLTIAVHRSAQWLWLELPSATGANANDRHLLHRIRMAQRQIGFDGGHVAISMHPTGPVSMSTAITLALIARLLAVRDHHVIAVLADGSSVPDVASRLIEGLPLVGPADHQHGFLAEVREQALATSHGWESVSLASVV